MIILLSSHNNLVLLSEPDLDVAKRDIQIYEKELREAMNKLERLREEFRKKVTGNQMEDLATFLVEYPHISDKEDQVFDRIYKLLEAYKTYTKLLEAAIGK